MKNLILVTLMMIVNSVAMADHKEKPRKITAEKMKQELIQEQLYYEGEFEGELDGLNASCTVKFENDDKSRLMIVLKTDKGLNFELVFLPDELVKVEQYSADDDSYTKTFSWGLTRKVSVVHSDDAYDTVTLENGTTKLTCGVWM